MHQFDIKILKKPFFKGFFNTENHSHSATRFVSTFPTVPNRGHLTTVFPTIPPIPMVPKLFDINLTSLNHFYE